MRPALTIILSTVTGMLIALPGAFSFSPLIGIPFILLFAAVGAKIGYMRRNSDGFFYFTLICSLALLWMLSSASIKAQKEASLPEAQVTGYTPADGKQP